MDLGIAGKKALVMSSSRGLGAGIAEALAAEGVDVLLTGRGEDRLKAQVEAINARGVGKADYVVSDLADAGCAATLAEAVKAKLGAADILIANTGGPPPGKMVDADITAIPVQFERMVTRVTEVASALLPHMREQKWGRIVVVGSSGVIQPIPTLGLSNLIRSSLVGWSKSMSNDLAAEGITVNMLLPGRIHTDRVDELDGNAAEKQGKTLDEVRIASRAGIPAGRYGTVEEFAAVATFLCSAQASYVTGSLVRCDGGSIKSV